MSTYDYDPFAGYDDNREIHQRINRTIRESADHLGDDVMGPPLVVWPDDWAIVDQMAEDFSKNDLAQTRHHDLRKLAASTVEDYLTYREKLIDPPEGMCVLFGFDHSVAFSIAKLEDAKYFAGQYLPAQYHLCDVQSARECVKVGATHVVQVVYGDFVCLYKACTECVFWFGDPKRRHHHMMGFGFSIASMGDDTRHPATQ